MLVMGMIGRLQLYYCWKLVSGFAHPLTLELIRQIVPALLITNILSLLIILLLLHTSIVIDTTIILGLSC